MLESTYTIRYVGADIRTVATNDGLTAYDIFQRWAQDFDPSQTLLDTVFQAIDNGEVGTLADLRRGHLRLTLSH